MNFHILKGIIRKIQQTTPSFQNLFIHFEKSKKKHGWHHKILLGKDQNSKMYNGFIVSRVLPS